MAWPAGVAELADALDSGSSGVSNPRVGSNPTPGTIPCATFVIVKKLWPVGRSRSPTF